MRNLAGFVIWKNQKFEENLKKFRSIRHFLSLNTNFGTCIKLKANKSQGRAHEKEVITRYRPSTLLTVAPMTRHFTKIWGPPNQSSPPPPASPSLRNFAPPALLSSALFKSNNSSLVKLYENKKPWETEN